MATHECTWYNLDMLRKGFSAKPLIGKHRHHVVKHRPGASWVLREELVPRKASLATTLLFWARG